MSEKKETKKATENDEKAQRANQIKNMARVYDQYMRRLLHKGGKRDEKRRARLTEIMEILNRGTIQRIVPLREGKTIVGKQKKLMPLTPRTRLRLIAEQVRLEQLVRPNIPEELHTEFIEILPKFAAHFNYSREVLIRSGVPEADLDAAGVLD